MASISERESCGVIHELFAGIDDKRQPGLAAWAAETSKPDYAPMPVWDPVQRRAVFPVVAPVYATKEEAESEARIDAMFSAARQARMRQAEPASGNWGKEDGGERKAKRKAGHKGKRRGKSEGGELEISDGEMFDLEAFEREMERRKLTVGEFRGAIRAGGFKAVHLVAQGPFFLIQGEPQGRPAKPGVGVDAATWLTLVTTRSRRNVMFLNPTVALAKLKELGVKSVQVDLDSWRVNAMTDSERRRPDMAERLQFAHDYAREGSDSKRKES